MVLLLGLAVRGVGSCRRKRRLGSGSLALRSAVLVRGLRRGRSSARSAPATLVRRWVGLEHRGHLELHATQLKLEPPIRANERERLLDQGDILSTCPPTESCCSRACSVLNIPLTPDACTTTLLWTYTLVFTVVPSLYSALSLSRKPQTSKAVVHLSPAVMHLPSLTVTRVAACNRLRRTLLNSCTRQHALVMHAAEVSHKCGSALRGPSCSVCICGTGSFSHTAGLLYALRRIRC